MKQYDVIKLISDLPEYNLSKGTQGTIIEVYEKPEKAYEIEFTDQEGNTLETLALKETQLELIWES